MIDYELSELFFEFGMSNIEFEENICSNPFLSTFFA